MGGVHLHRGVAPVASRGAEHRALGAARPGRAPGDRGAYGGRPAARAAPVRAGPLVYPRTTHELLGSGRTAGSTSRSCCGSTRPTTTSPTSTVRPLRRGCGPNRTFRSAPIVMLGTLWPQYWADFVTLPLPGQLDPHTAVRPLLRHVVRRVRVGERFSVEQLWAWCWPTGRPTRGAPRRVMVHA